jgi:uncharacterized protein (TIGR03437 family)
VNLSDNTQSWTASIFPANRLTAWLSASSLSGVGSGQITLTANGAGFEPGAYQATIVLQSANAIPQYMNVPVIFLLGGSASTSIGGVVLYGSDISAASPGTLLSIFGSNLANSTASASTNPLPFTLAGVSATVNDQAAPVLFVSPNVVNIQVPYEVGGGPAVLGINNNGAIAGFQFQIAPSSPAILSDSSGNLASAATVKQGGNTTLYVVGVGEVSFIKSGFSPAATASVSSLPRPVLPLSVTVGGVPAFVDFAGIAPGLIGLAQVNIVLPASVPKGTQQVGDGGRSFQPPAKRAGAIVGPAFQAAAGLRPGALSFYIFPEPEDRWGRPSARPSACGGLPAQSVRRGGRDRTEATPPRRTRFALGLLERPPRS